jgi:hypothetical protein
MLSAIHASTVNIAQYLSVVAYCPPTLLLLACAWREKRKEEENIKKKKKIEYDM